MSGEPSVDSVPLARERVRVRAARPWPSHPAPDRAREVMCLGERGRGGLLLRSAEGHLGRQGESHGRRGRRRRGCDGVPPQRLL